MTFQPDRAILLNRLDSLLSTMVEMLTRSLAQLVRGRISVPQFIVLKALQDSGKASVSQVAARLQITPSAVTYLADSLVRESLVERVRDELDRRVVWLRMTRKGLELIGDIQKRRREEMERITQRLSDAELGVLVSILDKLASSERRGEVPEAGLLLGTL